MSLETSFYWLSGDIIKIEVGVCEKFAKM